MAEVNIDAMLVKSEEVLTVQDKMVEMQNGCICCTLRDDLIEHVNKLAQEKRFDYLLIESTGISEPMPVAATFVTEIEGKAMLGRVARLDTLLTVVDGKNFFETYGTTERLVDRQELGAENGDQRNIASLLADQIECANVIVINKVDLLKEEEIVQLEAVLKKMNPKAELDQWPPHLAHYKSKPYGDKRSELVFISRDLDKAALRQRLENALVTEEEYQLGPEGVEGWHCRRHSKCRSFHNVGSGRAWGFPQTLKFDTSHAEPAAIARFCSAAVWLSCCSEKLQFEVPCPAFAAALAIELSVRSK
eukprot:Skav206566  [mRNA]  locus=scaffold925:104596:109657:- [translate_table: standard]